MAEISDNEIRIIGCPKSDCQSPKGGGHKLWPWVALVLGCCLAAVLFGLCSHGSEPGEAYDTKAEEQDFLHQLSADELEEVPEGEFEAMNLQSSNSPIDHCFEVSDNAQSSVLDRKLEVNGIPMRIFIPVNCEPSLCIGQVNMKDKRILLALQAADIRKDNGKIVGACVHKGKVVSEGLSKKGFVSIIDGNISVGVTEHSPYFEEATQKGGDFFRQYPLVSEGQVVENQPKNISIRRGLCQRGTQVFVAETEVPVSFHDFSQALVDINVNNAVYLVGSQYACGFRRNDALELESWGKMVFSKAKNISYLTWSVRE